MNNFQTFAFGNERRRWLQLIEKEKKIRWSRFVRVLTKTIGRPIRLQRLYRTKKLHIYAVAMVVMITWSIWYSRRPGEEDAEKKNYFNSPEEDLKDFVIESKGSGCVMPQLDPFDKGATVYERGLPSVACPGKDWVECYMDKCFVTKRIQEEVKELHCVYRDIVYANNFEHHMGLPKKLWADQEYRLSKSDHVEVSCVGTSRLRPGRPQHWSGHKTGLRQVPLRKRLFHGPRLSVLMLCLDSMSKNGFIRQMPKSYAALKKMEAMILNGYNIVGGGSSAALLPILTGNTKETRKRFTKDSFDEDSFIFSRMSRMGYRTAFFEDFPVFGGSRWMCEGFQDQPTDHYLLPLFLKQYGNTSRTNTSSFCLGDTPLYGLLLNITYQFSQLNGNRFSVTFISDTGRDNFNMMSAADEDLAFFLHRIQQGGMLKETVLFVMGNHGPSISSVSTVQAKLEERLPLMAIVLPERLKQSRPDAVAAMRANVDVLTTPFDIHSTLTDILVVEYQRNRYKVPGADIERGLTLLQPAGVPLYWCACADWWPLSPQNPIYKEIGDLVADFINSATTEWRLQCASRKLVSVEHVLLLLPASKILKYKNKLVEVGYLGKLGDWLLPRSKYYQAKVVMSPGRAVFEATLKYFENEDYFLISEEEVTRLNMHANESACMKNEPSYLKKYCYCR